MYDFKIILQLILVIYGPEIVAQDFELFGLEYSYFPDAAVRNSSDSVNINFNDFELSALAPIKASEQLYFLVGGNYRFIDPKSSETQIEPNLHFIALRLSTVINFSRDNSLMVTFNPAISSTLNSSLTRDDFLFLGNIIYRKKVSEVFSYAVGAAYTSRFGRPLALPIGALFYRGNKFSLNATLPIEIQATWNPNKQFTYGLKASVNGSQYNLPDGTIIGGVEMNVLNFSGLQVGPEIGIRIKGPLHLTLFGGLITGRTFYFVATNETDQDSRINNGGFISARISIKQPSANGFR